MSNPEFRRTILVGLGGAGQQIALRTKRLFLDTYGVTPPCLKLLCLDTDGGGVTIPSALTDAEYSLDAQEFLHMKVEQPREFLENSPEVSKWYVGDGPTSSIIHGAGAVRQNGRLALFSHLNELEHRIDRLHSSLNDPNLSELMEHAASEFGANTDFALSEARTEIYVFGSLAGGTGSGTFIDIGLLLRDIVGEPLIHGFFITSWVYRNKTFAFRTPGNAYAALAELDNLQSIMFDTPNFVPYTVSYGERKLAVRQAPYDLFHVIDGRNSYGESIDEVETLCDVVSNAIFMSTSSMSYPVQSVVDNLLAYINTAGTKLWSGKHARYSSIGVGSLHYPARELHRAVAADNALALCRAAIASVDQEDNDAPGPGTPSDLARDDVTTLLPNLGVSRANVRSKVSGDLTPPAITVEPYEMTDPSFPDNLHEKLSEAREDLEDDNNQMFERSGRAFINDVAESLERHLDEPLGKPPADPATRRGRDELLKDKIVDLRNQAAEDIEEATEERASLSETASQQAELAKKGRYLPWIGGPKLDASRAWAETATRLLSAVKAEADLTNERACYEALLVVVEERLSQEIPVASEIKRLLFTAERKLAGHQSLAHRTITELRNRPNHRLLGYGTTVVVPATGEATTLNRLSVPYDQFTGEEKIHSPSDYLSRAGDDAEELAKLFYDYCDEKHAPLANFTVVEALEALAQGSDDLEKFYVTEFEHLLRVAAAYWSFDRGKVTEMRAPKVGSILNFGFPDHKSAKTTFGSAINDALTGSRVLFDPSFSSTGDPSRIWLLYFAAALPAYFLKGLRTAKEKYEREMTPTYHIDRYLEMNVPDLFPEDDHVNQALRILGMAIVPGIDVIHDEKRASGLGHRFTCEHQDVTALKYDEPFVWDLFLDMYADVRNSHRDDDDANTLFGRLRTALIDRVSAMKEADQPKLRSLIKEYLERVKTKLEVRDFTKLISARLTYRELDELEKFLRSPAEGGYDMDVVKYLDG